MDGCDLKLFPGFRFHPTDEELVKHYLCRRCAGLPIHVPIIADVDLYKYDPWQLPGMAVYGEKEWYFFSPRDRKYPNGSRPNRAAGSGYWKATGADKPLGSPKPVAIKKALVFYTGKAPRGEKTNWIMHEYRLADVDRSPSKKHSLRLDDWVLCRIYNKKGSAGKPAGPRIVRSPAVSVPDPKPPKVSDPGLVDLMWFDGSSESAPRVPADSSCSEHVEVTCDREVQSRPRWGEMPIQAPSEPATWLPAMDGGELSPVFRDPLLHDVLMYLQKPF